MSQHQQIWAPAPGELRRAAVPRLIQEVQSLGEIAAEHFTPLTSEQLNWKPSPDEWSIGQCLDHIITTDEQYSATIEQAVQGTLPRTFWQRLPLLPQLVGTLLYRSMHPETTRPISAPRIFRPSSSTIGTEVYERFQAHQEHLIGLLRASQDIPIDNCIISSPVAASMVYSLGDAFRVIVVHQYLHLMQAERVKYTDGFPAASSVVS
jgi:hypothetical protein